MSPYCQVHCVQMELLELNDEVIPLSHGGQQAE